MFFIIIITIFLICFNNNLTASAGGDTIRSILESLQTKKFKQEQEGKLEQEACQISKVDFLTTEHKKCLALVKLAGKVGYFTTSVQFKCNPTQPPLYNNKRAINPKQNKHGFKGTL